MPGPAAVERGISPGAEIKPFSEVSAEEIAERTGGEINFFPRSGDRCTIEYRKLAARIWVDSAHPSHLEPGQERVTLLEIYQGGYGGRSEGHALDGTAVILEEERVIFVSPLRRSVLTGCEGRRLSWVEISREGIISNVVFARGVEPFSSSVDREIEDVAKWLSARNEALRG